MKKEQHKMKYVNADELREAAVLLMRGKLVAFPTETVYGLGGNALMDDAVAAIYEAKGRPSFNPLIVHVPSIAAAEQYVDLSDNARKLAESFWPGPLTLVLPRSTDCTLSLLVSAGLDSVAMRIPAHEAALALLKESGVPLAAPSANRSGRISPTEAAHVREELQGRVHMILDGGACAVGVESTVVDVTEAVPVILRHGAITKEMLEDVVGTVKVAEAGSAIKSPGMMEKHYAPDAQLRLNAKTIEADEALLAFGAPIAGAQVVQNLSDTCDLKEAAANLFRMLRLLDASGAKKIAVMPIPEEGLGVAINDRLRRAAVK